MNQPNKAYPIDKNKPDISVVMVMIPNQNFRSV